MEKKMKTILVGLIVIVVIIVGTLIFVVFQKQDYAKKLIGKWVEINYANQTSYVNLTFYEDGRLELTSINTRLGNIISTNWYNFTVEKDTLCFTPDICFDYNLSDNDTLLTTTDPAGHTVAYKKQ
jgi:hypothetical protein